MNNKKISVCVPSFNRPDTIRELINSFLKQSYNNKELVICDDSTSDEVEKVVNQFGSEEIIYIHNIKSLGFAQNLYKAITSAAGDFLVILGDDDILLKPETLSKYVKAFLKDEKIYYVYANQIQFSEKLDVQCEIKMFEHDKQYVGGIESFKDLLLTSIFIGGLGLRNEKKVISKYYPKEKILHPQVELSGNILLNHDAYTLKSHLIGFRSRESQFIFRALKNKKERQAGSHQNTELFRIFDNICKKNSLNTDSSFIFKRLLKDALIIYPKEKMILGNNMLLKNYRSFCHVSPEAASSLKLKLILLASLISPGWLIFVARKLAFFVVGQKNKSLLRKYKSQLLLAMS